MPEKAGRAAQRQLEKMGVEVRLERRVTDMRPSEVRFGEEVLPAGNIIWAAGVRGVPLAQTLSAPVDESGRVLVRPDLSVPEHPEIFVIGDLAHVIDPSTGQAVAGVAPAAIQMGRHVARILRAEIASGESPERPHFHYADKGTMATIGRNRAVASIRGINLSGFAAWLLWSLVHILSLIGFRKRVFVFLSWLWSYFSFTKSARLITGESELRITTPRGVLKEK